MAITYDMRQEDCDIMAEIRYFELHRRRMRQVCRDINEIDILPAVFEGDHTYYIGNFVDRPCNMWPSHAYHHVFGIME